MAEGLTVESYLDVGDRLDFNGDGDVVRLFADFGARRRPEIAWTWETRGAAPLITGGSKLRAMRAALASRTEVRPGNRARAR